MGEVVSTSIVLRQVALHWHGRRGSLPMRLSSAEVERRLVCPMVAVVWGVKRETWFGANVGRVRPLDAALCVRMLAFQRL